MTRWDSCAGCDQCLDDFCIDFRIATVSGGPHCLSENCAAVHVSRFQWRLVLQQQLNHFQLPEDGGPVQRSLTISTTVRKIDTVVQQELNYIFVSAGTRIQERRLKPLFRRSRFACDKALHNVEATHAGSSFQVQTSTAFCKVRSSLRAAIRKCSENRALPITSGDLVIDLCAVIEKQLQQRILHPGAKRMNAGRYQTERRRASAIHVRLGIDLRTTFQQ